MPDNTPDDTTCCDACSRIREILDEILPYESDEGIATRVESLVIERDLLLARNRELVVARQAAAEQATSMIAAILESLLTTYVAATEDMATDLEVTQ